MRVRVCVCACVHACMYVRGRVCVDVLGIVNNPLRAIQSNRNNILIREDI